MSTLRTICSMLPIFKKLLISYSIKQLGTNCLFLQLGRIVAVSKWDELPFGTNCRFLEFGTNCRFLEFGTKCRFLEFGAKCRPTKHGYDYCGASVEQVMLLEVGAPNRTNPVESWALCTLT